MIIRDRNKASATIWSIGDGTPVNETSTFFMKELIEIARSIDEAPVISAALKVGYNRDRNYIKGSSGGILRYYFC